MPAAATSTTADLVTLCKRFPIIELHAFVSGDASSPD